MAKTRSTRAKLQKVRAADPLIPRRLHPRPDEKRKLDRVELITAVCELFSKGHLPAEIADMIVERYGEENEMSREDPYKLIAWAAIEGWFSYHPPRHLEYQEHLETRYEGFDDVRVVHTAVMRDVAKESARLVMDLLEDLGGEHEVHIGLAGGVALRRVAKALAQLLRRADADELPGRLVFHSLVAGFDRLSSPTIDPMAFFTVFEDDPAITIEIDFVGLFAPGIVTPKEFAELREMDGIKRAISALKQIDILLTSAADWEDPDSLLRRFMALDPASMDVLEGEGIVGDLFWRPLNVHGPIENTTETRAFTLFELKDLPKMIKKGVRVVLTLGPCGACDEPKGRVLAAILDQPKPLVTHIVTDSGSAGQVFARDRRAA